MKRIAIPLLLSLSLLLSGCQNTDTGSNGGDSASTGAESVAVIDTAALFSDWDLDGSYDESAAVHIQLEGRLLFVIPTLSPSTAPGSPCWTRVLIWCPAP